jgi:hypothetical protein
MSFSETQSNNQFNLTGVSLTNHKSAVFIGIILFKKNIFSRIQYVPTFSIKLNFDFKKTRRKKIVTSKYMKKCMNTLSMALFFRSFINVIFTSRETEKSKTKLFKQYLCIFSYFRS